MTPVAYRFTSTKEWVDAFPVAYKQWKADDKPGKIPGCNKLHGYALSIKVYFGTNELDKRGWVVDYGGLKELKDVLADQLDHALIVASDDPDMDVFKLIAERGMAKIVELPGLGCERIADMLYRYINAVFIPDNWGEGESQRLWCYRVEVRETQSNMAWREGHREWNEDLIEGL